MPHAFISDKYNTHLAQRSKVVINKVLTISVHLHQVPDFKGLSLRFFYSNILKVFERQNIFKKQIERTVEDHHDRIHQYPSASVSIRQHT
jgi:hypothetical protein